MEKKLPNFIIIGAGKAGTTSVYNYVGQHPQIFMSPIKEPRYFAYTEKQNNDLPGHPKSATFPSTAFSIKTLEEYADLFKGARDEQVIGEATPIYLTSPVAAERIKKLLPKAKLLVVLRNPVDRAFSMYMMLVRANAIPWQVGEGFKKEAFKKDGPIVQEGFYCDNLKRYLDLFPKEQIKICLYDDLEQNPLSVIQDIYAYLGVDPSFEPDVSARYNVGGFPKSRRLSGLLKWMLKLWNKKQVTKFRDRIPDWVIKKYWSVHNKNLDSRIKYPQDLRRELVDLYREDILNLQDLIQRDLTSWLVC